MKPATLSPKHRRATRTVSELQLAIGSAQRSERIVGQTLGHDSRFALIQPWILLCLLGVIGLSGCAGFKPIRGVPVRNLYLPSSEPSRSGKSTIDLALLGQTAPPVYLVDSGDVLGVYIEGVLGRREEVPPVHFPENHEVAPSLGYPIPVRDDGTISMPLVGAIPVRGLSIRQVEETIRNAYVGQGDVLAKGRDRIFVSLQKPRTYRVLVVRQEAGNDANNIVGPGQINPGALKRGSGQVVNLPAYSNDVLHALAETGGLPGLDAENTIYIVRRRQIVPTEVPVHHHPGTFPEPIHPQYPPGPQTPPVVAPVSYETFADGDSSEDEWGHTSGQGVVHAQHVTSDWGHSSPQSAPTTAVASASMGIGNPYGSAYSVPQQPIQQSPALGYPAPPFAGPAMEPFAAQSWNGTPDFYDPQMYPGAFGSYAQTVQNERVVKIPVRLGMGEWVNVREQDVILNDGDIVFIETRDTEIFYTGGLLGGGQFTLPRDYDLDILGAIAIAQGQNNAGSAPRSIGGNSALNQDVTISASHAIILRPLPEGGQIPIQVDLYQAMRCPEERVVIQPGDYIILQYTWPEAIAAFLERHLLEGALFGLAAAQLNNNGNN